MPRLPKHLALIALFFCLPIASPSAHAQEREPSREPVLRIETGTHTSLISRISIDTANHYLVTVSNDKTARIWELGTGRLIRVIRPPIGEGSEGRLYAGAISPDANTVVVSGLTGATWDHSISIYVFDRESGRLIRRIQGLPEAVVHLIYSRDGKYLAATLGGKNGIRVYDTASYSLIAEDRSYEDSSFGADFDTADQLVTTSFDGFIRLYQPDTSGSFRLLLKRELTGGNGPYAVSFSPDGTKIAVGFFKAAQVSVLSSSTLSPIYTPNNTGVNGPLLSVVWSANGSTLYAAGYYAINGRTFIRAWTNGGRGGYSDLVAASDAIGQMLPLHDGGIVYGTAEPAFGLIDENGTRKLFIGPATIYPKESGSGLLLSADGSTIQFWYDPAEKLPVQFSIIDRKLSTPLITATKFLAPITASQEININDWYNTFTPNFNGKPLQLNLYELSRSLAIAPNSQQFLLGTTFYLRLFDRDGSERWNTIAPAEAKTVNISGSGRFAVAAYGDGTIRWYRMTDGKELLAFFPHKDRKRWILWTPSGYYDAAPGAEDLIGWHVNNGRDAAADFFPVGQFRNVYYRPDVVSKILQTGDEQLALKEANEEAGRKGQQASVAQLLPPVVEIVSPQDGAAVTTNEVTVRFNVRTPSGEPVTEVRALVDGRPATAERGLSLQANGTTPTDTRELRVAVPEGESQVSIIAANRFTTSVPATVRVRASKPVAASVIGTSGNDQFEIRPKLYVLAVGVSNYADPKLKLGFPAKDAQDFADAWMRQKGTLYRDVVVKVLTDDKATKDEVLDGLDWIRKETTSKDVAVVLFAGHGVNDANGVYYYLPFNADPDRLLRTGVSFSDIKNTIAAIAGKTLFFIDTCHSGNVLGTRRGIGNDINGVVNELASAENGAVVFAASTGNQYSLEKIEWGNGAFTKAVVEGLLGRADYVGRGRITINMLDLYISERVKELTAGNQTPTTAKPQTVPDFPVALKR